MSPVGRLNTLKENMAGKRSAEFAAAVVGLLRDRKMADQIGQTARQFVEQHYSWDGNLRRLEEIMLGKCSGWTC
jgi:glycosyltransferase involved in cell wall biosynthesis